MCSQILFLKICRKKSLYLVFFLKLQVFLAPNWDVRWLPFSTLFLIQLLWKKTPVEFWHIRKCLIHMTPPFKICILVLIGFFSECQMGYYWRNCSKTCPYPTYGKKCKHTCTCPADMCNFMTGCKTGKCILFSWFNI